MNCMNCAYFVYSRFFCNKLGCHVYLTDQCCHFKKSPKKKRNNKRLY
ncbi:hypothetical protein [Halanaerobaculum tunisiense]